MATKPKSPGTSNRARITVLRRLSSRSVQRIATDRKAPRIAVVGRVGLRLSFIARNRTATPFGALNPFEAKVLPKSPIDDRHLGQPRGTDLRHGSATPWTVPALNG